MRGSAPAVWILGGALGLLSFSPGAVYSGPGPEVTTPNPYHLLSATQVVGVTASSAGHGPLFSPASAALSAGLTSLYGALAGDRSLQTPLMNMLLVGVPVDTSLPPADLQDAANTATGLGFGNSTTGRPLSAGRGGSASTAHHRSGGAKGRGAGMSGGRGGGGGGGHHGGKSAAGPHRPSSATGKAVPAKH
jgi:hypothetical protein